MLSTSSEIGKYKIGQTIGRGTFGKVKRGTHTITNEPVAIKILQKGKIKDVTDVERVSRQLHILRQVRHSTIAQLYEIVESPTHILMVMEYASEGEFFDYIMDGKVSGQAEAHHYFAQILSGLEYLHDRGIAHRDIKPENMLLDVQNKLKIVDFGLSNMYTKGQKLTTACGSPCYASPQMIKGEDYDPELTDVWSLGVVLFTILMAKLPFEDDNTTVLYSKIKSGMYILDRRVSDEFKDLISRLINVKPDNRLKIKEIKKHPWFVNFQNIHSLGIHIGFQKIPIDDSILNIMKNYGFSPTQTRRYLECNIQNESTATYYLFLKKELKAGKDSHADICSQYFDINLLKPLNKKIRHKSMDFTQQPFVPDSEKLVEKKKIQRKCFSQMKRMEIQTNNFLRSSFDNNSCEQYSYAEKRPSKIQFNNLSVKSGKQGQLRRSLDRSKSRKLKETDENHDRRLINRYAKQQKRLKTQYIRQAYIKDFKRQSPKKGFDISDMYWKKKKTNIKGNTRYNQKANTRPIQKSNKRLGF